MTLYYQKLKVIIIISRICNISKECFSWAAIG